MTVEANYSPRLRANLDHFFEVLNIKPRGRDGLVDLAVNSKGGDA